MATNTQPTWDAEVTPERAKMLAAHATLVQGGFSTPEIEAERAAKDLEKGPIDWDKMQAEVLEAVAKNLGDLPAPTVSADEAQAAEDEDLYPMPADLIDLYHEERSLKVQVDALNERKNEIRDTFRKRMEEDNAQGYMLYGKVKVRRSTVNTPSLDSKKLKEELPHIWQKFMRMTKSVRMSFTS